MNNKFIHPAAPASHGVTAALAGAAPDFGSKTGTNLSKASFPQPFPTTSSKRCPSRAHFGAGGHTCQEADPPEPRVQRQLDFGRLVLGLDDALLQVEPVVGADGDAQEAEAADGKHAAEQGQRLPAARAHPQKHGGGNAVGRGAGVAGVRRFCGRTEVSKALSSALDVGGAEISHRTNHRGL